MSHIISMHRLDDSRQTAVSDLSKVILCLVAPRFKHSTVVIRAKQHNHSITEAPVGKKKFWTRTPINNVELSLLKKQEK